MGRGEGNGNRLQYSCLGNPMDREPDGLQSMGSQSWTWLSDWHFYFQWIQMTKCWPMRWSINCWTCWEEFPESLLKEEQAAKDNSLALFPLFCFFHGIWCDGCSSSVHFRPWGDLNYGRACRQGSGLLCCLELPSKLALPHGDFFYRRK